MKTPTGYVALRKGRQVRNCIFLNWCDAEEHIKDYNEAEYSVIDTLQDAEKYIIINNDCTNISCSALEEFATVAATTSTTTTAPDQSTSYDELDSNNKTNIINTNNSTTTNTTTIAAPLPPNAAFVDVEMEDSSTNKDYKDGTRDQPSMEMKQPQNQLTASETTQRGITEVQSGIPNSNVKITNGTTEAVSGTAMYNISKYDRKDWKDWKGYFQKLASYRKPDGTYPKPIPDEKVRKWFSSQKNEYRKKVNGLKNCLNDEREDLLRSIGMDLSHDRRTNITKNKNNTKNYNDDKDGRNASEKYHLQNWNKEFDTMVTRLKEFKAEHGSCHVTKRHTDYQDLFYWYLRVKKEYQKLSNYESANNNHKSRLSSIQIAKLTDIGVEFKTMLKKYKTFNEWIEQLKEYQRTGGEISKITHSHPIFGEWVGRQRKAYRHYIKGDKKSWLNKEQINILNNLGFEWNIDKWIDPKIQAKNKSWDDRYNDLIKYKKLYGHVLVPKRECNGLGLWVQRQRQNYKLMLNGNNTKKNGIGTYDTRKSYKITKYWFYF